MPSVRLTAASERVWPQSRLKSSIVSVRSNALTGRVPSPSFSAARRLRIEAMLPCKSSTRRLLARQPSCADGNGTCTSVGAVESSTQAEGWPEMPPALESI
jgi:hypothetical protein